VQKSFASFGLREGRGPVSPFSGLRFLFFEARVSTRSFDGLGAFEAALARMAVEQHVVLSETVGIAAHITHRHVTETFGDQSKLAALSPFTQADRESMGYTPADPLLRDGSLLRDHVEIEHHDLEAGVGSAEPVQLYSEMGFVNHRTGRSVPPRPVFKIGLDESEVPINTEIDAAVELLIDGRWRPRP
jgi:hypothetical protein